MENSLSSSNTPPSNPSGGNSGGGTVEASDASKDEEEEAVHGSFKFSAFASLAHRISRDDQSLQKLERLRARWHARYGDCGSGTMSTSIGALVGSHLSETRTMACGSSLRARVSASINPLPPARVLLQEPTLPSSPQPGSPTVPSQPSGPMNTVNNGHANGLGHGERNCPKAQKTRRTAAPLRIYVPKLEVRQDTTVHVQQNPS
ncbi:hypothetical protein Salat_2127100 [Sesamum alatum]|uniref:Uncharacterized protein n=1 Tax=Sesamum alatum TaxID=300844 RepID=A0AAE1Y118_9LAMI|nr:hypothetical protein Salat_2127100 [Sesamum alatum]